MDDLTDISHETYIVNHTVLLGRLQDHSGCFGLDQFDDWLVTQGIKRDTTYIRIQKSGAVRTETLTLPTAVRHMIHHSENPHNVLTDAMLEASTEMLLKVARMPSNALPGLQ